MPRCDGTGPRGKGSQTGNGLGKCNGKIDTTESVEDLGRQFRIEKGASKGKG